MLFKFIFCVIFGMVSAEDDCHDFSPGYFNYLGTKTPYRLIANLNTTEIGYEGCEPIKIWMMIRHGTRNPGDKLITSMNTQMMQMRDEIVINHEEGKNDFCDGIVRKFEAWSPMVAFNKKKILVTEGEEEMVELAKRFKKRLPGLFPDDYSAEFYQFRSTSKQRAIESKRHFMIGLFGPEKTTSLWPPKNTTNDLVLRFYKQCPRWKRDVDDNPLSLLAKMKYEGSEEWMDMTKNISVRLGIDYVLDQGLLHDMYTVCGFETAWQKNYRSPWCGIFTQEELAAFELSEDLEYYHIDGYGHDLNYLQACPAVRDLILHLTSNTGPKTIASFTHSGTILKLLSHFGLYNDTNGRAHLPHNRKWRVSKIDAFGSNIIFILFQCKNEKKFLALHQERPVVLEGCPKDDLCPLEVLLKTHGGSLTNCKFEQMCSLPKDELMNAKQADRVHLIENQYPKNVGRDRKGLVVPPNTPVATVVISAPTGVHVTPQRRNTPAVDKRTGRYLALGVTLTMIFIMLYHTFLRQVPVLAGLIPPAIIMVLYLVWIVYFAKKRKRQVEIELV